MSDKILSAEEIAEIRHRGMGISNEALDSHEALRAERDAAREAIGAESYDRGWADGRAEVVTSIQTLRAERDAAREEAQHHNDRAVKLATRLEQAEEALRTAEANLSGLARVAAQHLDTGRGDLDGWVARAEDYFESVLVEDHTNPNLRAWAP